MEVLGQTLAPGWRIMIQGRTGELVVANVYPTFDPPTIAAFPTGASVEETEDIPAELVVAVAPPLLGVEADALADRVEALDAPPPRPGENMGPDYWAAQITASWRASVAGILQTGRHARDADRALDLRGRRELVAALPFGEETFRRLVAIGEAADQLEPLAGALPASWRSIWAATRVPFEQLAEAVDAGRIHPEVTRAELLEALEAPPEGAAHPAKNGEGWERQAQTIEHYTPLPLLERCRQVLGGIDLDPCATARRLLPGIQTHYTIDHRIEAGAGPRVWGETAQPDAHGGGGGLVAPWRGRVFVNPPYGRLLPLWVARFRQAFESGEMDAGILLAPGRIGTGWWRSLQGAPRAELQQRVPFVDGRGEDVSDQVEGEVGAPFPSVLFYLGPRCWDFADVFSDAELFHVQSAPTVALDLGDVDRVFLEDLVDPSGTASLDAVRAEARELLEVLRAARALITFTHAALDPQVDLEVDA